MDILSSQKNILVKLDNIKMVHVLNLSLNIKTVVNMVAQRIKCINMKMISK